MAARSSAGNIPAVYRIEKCMVLWGGVGDWKVYDSKKAAAAARAGPTFTAPDAPGAAAIGAAA
jgi:hypothetical protein